MNGERFLLDTVFVQALLNQTVDTVLLTRALQLYEARSDKLWGLTDCISFVVMEEQGLLDAVTTDKHFVQAGYGALLLGME